MSHSESCKPVLPAHVVAWKSVITILIIAPWAMAALVGYKMMFLLIPQHFLLGTCIRSCDIRLTLPGYLCRGHLRVDK